MTRAKWETIREVARGGNRRGAPCRDRAHRREHPHPPSDGRRDASRTRTTSASPTSSWRRRRTCSKRVFSLDRRRVTELFEAVLAFRAISVDDHKLILRALEVYERDRLDVAEAYPVALAEVTQIRSIASFDRAIDRAGWIERVEP